MKRIASLVLILCEPSAPRHNAHGPMLVEASARTKTSAPIITSMSLDCQRHLGAPGHDGADVLPARCPQ